MTNYSFVELIPELAERNFSLSEYLDSTGRKLFMFNMDRQGFSMLVNKFTGDKVKYAIRNIERILSSAKYTELIVVSCKTHYYDK